MKQTNTCTGQKNLMKQHSNHTQLPISTQPCFTQCLAGFSSEEIISYRRPQNPLTGRDPNCSPTARKTSGLFFAPNWFTLQMSSFNRHGSLFSYIYIVPTALRVDLNYLWQSVTSSHLEKGSVLCRMWKPTYWHLPATARSCQSILKQV